jgi:release factor glutamine methyltransferase
MTEAELLFTDILNCSRASLYLDSKGLLDKDKAGFVSSVLKRRIKGEPIQYILGKAEFMGFNFLVNEDVLIPRPETEILVETAAKLVSSISADILELGTGSGCIAISLAKMLASARIIATDISEKAVKIAGKNAALNNVKIDFLVSDLFGSRALQDKKFNLIVSNPPYIPSLDIDKLQPEVRHEPRVALDAGEDGLGFYRRIAKEAPRYLKDGAFLVMEIGFGQKESVKNILQKSGYFEIMEWVKDYNGIDRIVVSNKRKG